MTDSPSTGAAWRWVPTLYFAQGLPYVVVMTVAVVLYKNLGLSNTDIALYTSWLYLPWVIKPLWSPLVDLLGQKRRWVVVLQAALGVALALVGLTLPGPHWLIASLSVFWLMAFASATHDIAADGFYMLALPAHDQAAFVGVRGTFYRLAMIAGQGGLVYLAGTWAERMGGPARGWAMVFYLAAAVYLGLSAWHAVALPRPAEDAPTARDANFWAEFGRVFADFFRQPGLFPLPGGDGRAPLERRHPGASGGRRPCWMRRSVAARAQDAGRGAGVRHHRCHGAGVRRAPRRVVHLAGGAQAGALAAHDLHAPAHAGVRGAGGSTHVARGDQCRHCH